MNFSVLFCFSRGICLIFFKNSFTNIVSNTSLETAPGSALFGWEINEYRKSTGFGA